MIFQSDQFTRTPPATNEESETNPWGKDLAVFLAEKLEARGVKPLEGQPSVGFHSWFLLFPGGFTLRVYSAWDHQSVDWWVIAVNQSEAGGCLTIFFGRKPGKDEDVEPMRVHIKAILESDLRMKSVRWLTQQEYDQAFE